MTRPRVACRVVASVDGRIGTPALSGLAGGVVWRRFRVEDARA